MANGRTHAAYSAPVATVITIACGIAAATVHPALFAPAIGAWAAHIATPDLDHEWTTYDEQRIYRLSPALGTVWRLYWMPYERLAAHRGRSHTLPWGTFDRFALLFWLPIAFTVWHWGALAMAWWTLAFAGQCAVDAVHLWLDGMI